MAENTLFCVLCRVLLMATETVDKEMLNSLPCHLGALVCAKGSENFYCLHREQFMDSLEFDMVELIRLLIRIFENQ